MLSCVGFLNILLFAAVQSLETACIDNCYLTELEGRYQWEYFDVNLKAPVYKHDSNGKYLFVQRYPNNNSAWLIGAQPGRNMGLGRCWMGSIPTPINGFNPQNCTQWKFYNYTLTKWIPAPIFIDICETNEPTTDPTFAPTQIPSQVSEAPTAVTNAPTTDPTVAPSSNGPTETPTNAPLTSTASTESEPTNDELVTTAVNGPDALIVAITILGVAIIGLIFGIVWFMYSRSILKGKTAQHVAEAIIVEHTVEPGCHTQSDLATSDNEPGAPHMDDMPRKEINTTK